MGAPSRSYQSNPLMTILFVSDMDHGEESVPLSTEPPDSK